FPMTVEGSNRLKAELDHLKKVERPQIVNEIEVARAHGDLKENAEYHAAKEKQGMVEARIKELEVKLTHAEVIDPRSLGGDRVLFGATVTIFEIEGEEEVTYQIVGEDEADIKDAKISYASPIAKALIGKEVGEEVVIKAPKGNRPVEIVEVEFV
ncbi:MAG: transcription elongation factor GreA, partial [Myxococcota bacterium]